MRLFEQSLINLVAVMTLPKMNGNLLCNSRIESLGDVVRQKPLDLAARNATVIVRSWGVPFARVK